MKEYPVYIGGFHQFTREQLAKAGVFIAHDFFGDDDTKRVGYRNKFDIAFRDTPYMPVYAPIDSGTILETLTQSMVNCFAGIFDVTTNRRLNANVLIELGVCLAINHPAIVIAEGTDPLPDFLETLKPLRYTGRRDLIIQLSQQLDERITESQRLQHGYCVICRRTDCGCRTSVPMEDKTYMLLGAHVDDDEVDIDVEEALLHFNLKRLQIAADDALNLCEWLRLVKRVRFAFFYSKALGKAHHGEENAATMVQLGMAVGSPTPWRIIVPVDEFAPTDVSAFMAVIRNPNARIFQDRISGAASKLLEEFNPLRVVNTAVLKPNFDEWVGDEVKETAKITSPLAKSNSYIFIGYASDDGKEYATLIHDILDEMKVNNWISLNGFETRNRYGEDWREQIIPQAEIAFIVVTSSSPNSRSIRVELDLALEKGVPVILLIAPNTDLNTLDELVSAIPSENTIPVIELDSVDRSSIQASIIAVMPTITSADFTLYPSSTTTLDRLISSQRAAAKSKDDPKAIDVFISYARKDGAEHAARLQAELTKLSLSVWLDMNFVTLQDFSVEIEKAIKRADIVLVLLTSDVNRRDSFVRREISYALALNKRIILLSFEDIIPPISIANLTRIDFFRDWDSGFERLKRYVSRV